MLCETCGQKLPENKILEFKTQQEQKFNVEKANNLVVIQTQGRIIKNEIEKLRESIGIGVLITIISNIILILIHLIVYLVIY